MELSVIPESLTAASAQVDALVARLAARGAAHQAISAATLPPGADPVSIKAKLGVTAQALLHEGVAELGNEEMGRASMGTAESAMSYTTGDSLGGAALGEIAL